jgi:hypothetical protein
MTLSVVRPPRGPALLLLPRNRPRAFCLASAVARSLSFASSCWASESRPASSLLTFLGRNLDPLVIARTRGGFDGDDSVGGLSPAASVSACDEDAFSAPTLTDKASSASETLSPSGEALGCGLLKLAEVPRLRPRGRPTRLLREPRTMSRRCDTNAGQEVREESKEWPKVKRALETPRFGGGSRSKKLFR